jgi:hypothetical protein
VSAFLPIAYTKIPSSDSEEIDLSKEAGENLSAGKVVYVTGNKAYKASQASHPNPIGIVAEDASIGLSARIVTEGPVTIPTWSLTQNTPYFLSTNGDITATPPSSGYIIRLGVAASSTTLVLEIHQPVLLA